MEKIGAKGSTVRLPRSGVLTVKKEKIEIKDKRVNSGIGFLELLAVLFIGLKLAGAIDWSWWWVLSPLWFPIAGVLVLLGLMIAVVVIGEWLGAED